MDGCGTAGGASPVPVRGHRIRRAGGGVRRQRFHAAGRRAAFQHRPADALSNRCRMGRPRGIDAAVGADARALERGGVGLQPPPAHGLRGACHRGDGSAQRRLPGLPAVHLEPFRAAVAGRCRRTGLESAASGSRNGVPSAASLHGLCRLLGRLRLRHRRAFERAAGCNLGTLVAALDDGGMDVPDAGDRAGQLLGLLRTGLGRKTPRSCPGWSAPP
jgi:hypothetical protein